MAKVLRESVREQDQTFRLGGEEFLVLLPEADQATALMVAERIRLSMHQLDLAGEAPEGRLTVSLGGEHQPGPAPFRFLPADGARRPGALCRQRGRSQPGLRR